MHCVVHWLHEDQNVSVLKKMPAADQKTARIEYRERFHLGGFIFKISSDSKFYSDWSFTGSFTFSQKKNTVTERS